MWTGKASTSSLEIITDALKRVRTLSGTEALDTGPDLSGEEVGTRFTVCPLGIASVEPRASGGQFISRDVCAGIVIAFPAHSSRSGYIVAVAGFVEGHAHIFGKGNRPLALDTFDDEML